MSAWSLVLVGFYLQGGLCDLYGLRYPLTSIAPIDVIFQNKSDFTFGKDYPLTENRWNFTCTVKGNRTSPSNLYWTIQQKSRPKLFIKYCNRFDYQRETRTNICNITMCYINYYNNHVFSCHFNNETAKMFTVISSGYEIVKPSAEMAEFRPTLSILGTDSTEYSPGDNLNLECIANSVLLGTVSKLTLKWIFFNLTDGSTGDLVTSNYKSGSKSIEIYLNYTFKIQDDGHLLICECRHEDFERYGQKIIPLNLKLTKRYSATEQGTTEDSIHGEDTEGSVTTNTAKYLQEVSTSWKTFLVLGVVVSAVLVSAAAAGYALIRQRRRQRGLDPQAQEELRVAAMYTLPTKTDRGGEGAEQRRWTVTDSLSGLEELQTNENYVGYTYDYVGNISVRSDASEEIPM